MTHFAYVARDPSGRRVEGRVQAGTRRAALAELAGRDLAPIDVSEVRAQGPGRMGPRRLSNCYRQLADLLRSGVPLLRALRLLARGRSDPKLAAVMGEVADDVADGVPLADALDARGVFPDVHVAMVRAGEKGGFLEPVFRRLATFLEGQADLRGKVLGNLLYPAVLVTFGLGVVVFALVVIVPKFGELFEGQDALPLATRILLAVSGAVTDGWMWTLAGLVVAVIAARAALADERVRKEVARLQLRLPVAGQLVRDLAVGRFARVLGTLLDNGIPMLPAMRISRDAAGHPLLADAIDDAIEAVRAGESLAVPLEASSLFGDDAIEVIRVGEAANNLPEVLGTLADRIEDRVERLLTTLVRLMEPLLLLALGGMVFFIFLAVVVPMMQLSGSV